MAVITFQQALDRLAAFEAATESDVGRRVSTLLGQGLTAAQKAAARANIGAAARDEVVLKRGRQTVFGDVTFERPVGVPAGSIPQDRVTGLPADLASKLDAADIAGKADANAVVDLTTAQTVAGAKTFSTAPVVPDGSFTQAKVANLTTDLAGKAADNAVVKLTGDQSVAGAKTFSTAPVVPDGSFTQAKVANLVTDLAGKAADNAVVKLTGDQTVAGAKTFSTAPVVPDGSFTQAKVANLVTDLASKVGKRERAVTPLDFGATANGGVADAAANSTAFQACSDWASAHGVPMEVPGGEYYLTASRGYQDLISNMRPGRGWIIDKKVSVTLARDAVLRLAPSDLNEPTLLQIWGTDDVSIDGGTWIGERDSHIGGTGEWGHLIGIACCSNVKITNVNIAASWGDGISGYCWPPRTTEYSGTGYTAVPTVTVTPAAGDTTGSGCVGVAVLGNGVLGAVGTVNRITVSPGNYGSGYTLEPVVTITNAAGDVTGNGAVARAMLAADGTIRGISIVDSVVNKNIEIRNFTIDRASRNGITVGAADNFSIENGTISNTDRVAPKFGIDCEPDGDQPKALGVTVKHVKFVGNVVGGVALGGGNGTSGTTIEDCVFVNNGVGVSALNTSELTVQSCRVSGGPLASGAVAVYFSNVTMSNVVRNWVDVGDTATLGKTGIVITGGSSRITVEGNTVRRSNRGISINGGSQHRVIGNTVREIGTYCLRQEGTVSGSLFANNILSGTGGSEAAYFLGFVDSAFIGNHLSDLAAGGVYGVATNSLFSDNITVRWSLVSNTTAFQFTTLNGCSIRNNYFTAAAGRSQYAIEELNVATTPNTITNNHATYSATVNPFQKLRAPSQFHDNYVARSAAAPTSGTWVQGQIVMSSEAAASGTPLGWICTTGGTPGTWSPVYNIGMSPIADAAANTIFRLPWNGTDWTYKGTAVGASRPSARTDVHFDLYGAPAATADPAWMLANDSRTDV